MRKQLSTLFYKTHMTSRTEFLYKKPQTNQQPGNLPKCIQGDRLLRAFLFGLLRSLPKYLSLSVQNDSSMLTPCDVPGRAQSTGGTFMSTSRLAYAACQSTLYKHMAGHSINDKCAHNGHFWLHFRPITENNL